MQPSVTRSLRSCASTLLLLCLLVAHGAGAEPPAGSDAAASPWLAVPLVDQEGRPFRLETLRGKLVLLSFVFTRCPGPCPALTSHLVDLQHELGDDLRAEVHLVSLGIDPEDRIEDLVAFARARGVAFDGWSFVSGRPDDVRRLAGHFASELFAGEDGEPDHRLAVFLLDREGRNVQRYAAADLDVSRVLRDVRALASQ